MDSVLNNLLELQTQDLAHRQAKEQLEKIPGEIAGLKAKLKEIDKEEVEVIEALKALEVERKKVEGDIAQSEDKIVKFKTQQASVKKNEEYEAFNKEIANEQTKIDELENRGLELLEDIENQESGLEASKVQWAQRREELNGQIEHLNKQERDLKGKIKELEHAKEEASKDVDVVYLDKYEQVANQVKRGPYVVPLSAGRCQGCHLKVSQEVIGLARKAEEPCQCDNCTRLLYWEG